MPGRAPDRRGSERKGDARQRVILDTCQTLLADRGYDDMTVADIAAGAGLARGALYFYFGSKDEVVTALVGRTVEQLWERSSGIKAIDDPREAVRVALQRTVDIWTEHSVVLRTAIDRSATVPSIGALWDRTAAAFTDGITSVLERAGVASGDGPDDAAAIATALCWMIERSFYKASLRPVPAYERAARTCEYVWLASAKPAPGPTGPSAPTARTRGSRNA